MDRYDELVSVIIPIYNVEQYLEPCIKSILTQTYDNLEIILVDDGSTDESLAICDRYRELDNRIIVIHKSNSGLSDARNAGLNRARGKYILFVDSDDVISTKMVEILLGICEEYDADIGVCTYLKFCDDEEIVEVTSGKLSECSGKELIKIIYKDSIPNISFIAVNKLYRHSLFEREGIIFPSGRVYEDMATTYKLLYDAKKVVVIESALYFYRIRSNSIMTTTFTKKKCIDKETALTECIDFFIYNKECELTELSLNAYCKTSFMDYQRIGCNKEGDNKEIKRIAREFYKTSWRHYRKFYPLGFKRIFYELYFCFPNLMVKCKIRK